MVGGWVVSTAGGTAGGSVELSAKYIYGQRSDSREGREEKRKETEEGMGDKDKPAVYVCPLKSWIRPWHWAAELISVVSVCNLRRPCST